MLCYIAKKYKSIQSIIFRRKKIMFKRSSKMTALLVAAAAVVSIVPASASERLGTKGWYYHKCTCL